MATIFIDMLKNTFSGDSYIIHNERSEIVQISRIGIEAIVSLEDIKRIARNHSEDLPYIIYKAHSEGTIVSKGSVAIEFLKGMHLMGFMPPEYKDLAVNIGLSWRGKPNLTEQERRIYSNILKSYFNPDNAKVCKTSQKSRGF